MSDCYIYRTSKSFVKNIDKFSNIVYNLFKDNVSNLKKDHSVENIKKMLTSSDFYSIFIYDYKSSIIGYVLGEFELLDDGRYCYFIKYLYVTNEYKNENIEKALIARLKNDVKKEFGVNFIFVFCNVNNLKIYEFYKNNNFSIDKLSNKDFGYKEFLSKNHFHVILSCQL